MSEYKLPHGFKRDTIKDAVYSVYHEGKSLRDWGRDFLFFQEVVFPGEKEYVHQIVSTLVEADCNFEPYSHPNSIENLVLKIDEK